MLQDFTQTTPLHLVSSLLGLQGSVPVSQNAYQVFCRMPLNLGMIDIFPKMMMLEVWVLRWRTTEVKYHSHPVTSRARAINMTCLSLIILKPQSLVEIVFVPFPHCIINFPTVQTLPLWKPVIKHSPKEVREREDLAGLPIGKREKRTYINYLQFLCRELSLFPHLFVYAIIYLY